MSTPLRRNLALSLFANFLYFALSACNTDLVEPRPATSAAPIVFGPTIELGDGSANPAAPFLRYAPDGRLFAIWTQDDHSSAAHNEMAAGHRRSGGMISFAKRVALLASSADEGRTWTQAKRVNSTPESVQSDENAPKVAFGPDNRAYVLWAIPNEKGDITRANVRFAAEDGRGGFTPARTLNEVKDAARFPIIELAPDGNFLIAWIDRRIDNPKPRQLYLMRLDARGRALTKNYLAGEGLCECCKLGIAFGDGGKQVYMVDRQVNDEQIRNHVLRKSTDGGASFGAPVQISDDGWQVPSCPHSGPTIGRDSRGQLHVTWFTMGRSEQEAGIYYSVSRDDGKTFAARQLVHGNTAPEVLYSTLAVGDNDTVYLAWSNLDRNNRAQIYLRTLAADGQTWSPIQQISDAKGNAGRPALALRKNQLHVAWTETDGENSRVVSKSATVTP